MSWLGLLLASWISIPAKAQDDGRPPAPPPAWIVQGFEAAVADPADGMAAGALRLPNAAGLAGAVPAGGRASAVIDRLLPLLGDSNSDVRRASVEALGRIPHGDRAGAVIDRLLPLLGDSKSNVRTAAAEALGRIPPGDRAGAVIDRLLPLLGDRADNVDWAAADAIGTIATGDRAGAVIDNVLPLFADDDVPWVAVEVLGRIAVADRADAVIDRLLPILDSGDNGMRWAAAANVLGRIATGDRAVAVIDRLLLLFDNGNPNARQTAIGVLSRIATGDRTITVIDRLLPIILGDDRGDRWAAVDALRGIAPGDHAGAVIDRLLPLLNNDNSDVRWATLEVLGRTDPGDRAGAIVESLLPLLDHGNSDESDNLFNRRDQQVRQAAAEVLGRIAVGDRAGAVIDRLLPLLDNRNLGLRRAAVEALGRITPGDRAGVVISRLLLFFDNRDRWMIRAAAQALGRMVTVDHSGAVIDRLLPLLDSGDGTVLEASAEALGRIRPGDRAGAVTDRLLPLLGEGNGDVRKAAVEALGRIAPGHRAGTVTDRLLPLIGDGNANVRSAAVEALGRTGPGGVSTAIRTAQLVHGRAANETPATRAAGHLAIGAGAKDDGADVILAWLGRPNAPVSSITARPEAANAILVQLLRYWDDLATPVALREEAEARIMTIAYAACSGPMEAESTSQQLRASLRWLYLLPLEGPVQRCWQPEQLTILKALLTRFRSAGSTHAPALAAMVHAEEAAPVWQFVTWSVLGWTAFWITFLLAFPWSRSVQAAFFWNPQLRRMLSLWFVPLLLFALPPLRRRLLAPFRDALLAPARLDDLTRLGFFGQGRAQPARGAPAPLNTLLHGLRGTVVLRGDAGLGKSSALQWYTAHSRRPVAFLGARDCAEGVDVAIARLIHNVQETGFVRSLVHTGSLTVIVDGLNEVSAATREKISAFAADMTKGHILIGTQPIEWTLPATAQSLDLLPLNRAEAKAFLLSRPVGADPGSRVKGQAYVDAVEKFLRRNLDDPLGDDEQMAAAHALSNPFDLTLAADLLAQGLLPPAASLIDEAFRMAEYGTPGEPGYRAVVGQPFPLVRFGQLAVTMRLEDRRWFKPDEFPAELSCLIKRRLLMQRVVRGATGDEERVLFRHERVWDFFVVAAFKEDPSIWSKHLAEPRFRSAYLRIAETWPIEDADRVRDLLIVSAAERGDHTTSDPFIKRLEVRRKPRTRTRRKGDTPSRAASTEEVQRATSAAEIAPRGSV